MKSLNNLLHAFGMLLTYGRYTVFVFIGLSYSNSNAQQLAFPSASGAGAYVSGGRGGSVYHVTNLNNSGPGSFRDAVSGSNRTIVFDVSGTIELTYDLSITASNLTIAGQTAPEGGITITGSFVHIQNNQNIILRYLRFRPNYDSSGSVDALNAYNCRDIIVDHCSVSWGGDEAFSLRGTSADVTIKNCIFAESATGMLAGESGNMSSDNFSVIGNLWYNISHRFPNVNVTRTDVINNVVHNWYSRLMVVSNRDGAQLNEINNFYQRGVTTSTPPYSVNWLDIGYASQRSNIRIFTDGNVYPSVLTEAQNDWDLYVHRFNVTSGAYAGTSQWDQAQTDFQVSSPFEFLGEAPDIMTAEEALAYVPLNAGANKYMDDNGVVQTAWDAIDNTYVNHVINNTSEFYSYPPTAIVSKPSYVNFHNSVTSTPINTRPSSYDTDNDGMADIWEMNMYGTLSHNGTEDTNNNGYTDLEEFLNGVDAPETSGNQVAVSSDDSDNTICFGEDVTLTAADANSYIWDNAGETSTSITVSPEVTTTYTVTGIHSDGSTTEAEITITVNPLPIANAGDDIETCLGTEVTLTASGGISYEWSTGETTQSITVNPNTTTTYSVEVTENECVSTDAVTVTVNSIPNVDAGEDQTIFEGETATLTATGADSYLWSTGETTQTIQVNPLLDTSYAVTGTTNGCQSTDNVTVFLLDDSVAVNAGSDVDICNGTTITLTATGGTTYLWSTGETTPTIDVSPTTTTTYTVTAYSPSGNNEDQDDVTVTVNEIPVADAGTNAEICLGDSITLTASGGSSYLWNTGETTQSITVNPTETSIYTVEVFENNCASTDDIEITVNPIPVVDAGEDVTIIEGESTILTASGADTYLWNTGETTSSITVSPSETTNYSVTGFVNGCENSSEVLVTVIMDEANADAGADVDICLGETTILTASGGTTYLWNTGETSETIEVSPTETTTYTLTAFSPSGINQDQDEVTVTVNPLPVANAGIDVEICLGNETILSASGGSSYLWNTGETTQDIAVSPTTTTVYSVEVFDSNCSSMDDVQVTVLSLPDLSAGNDVTIFDGESTTLTASGADTYLWNTGETTESIEVSPNDTTTYSVTGYFNGCEATDDILVTVLNDDVTANAGEDVDVCTGETITLTASGGATYLWNTGETTESIDVTPTETTTYTVTAFSPSGNNQDQDDVVVFVNPLPNANAGDDVSICSGNTTTLTATGGVSYLWNTGETSQSITVNPSETTIYSVQVSDGTCSAFDDVEVSVIPLPNVNAGIDTTIFDGESTTLTASGADSYLWNTGETTQSITVSPNTTTTYTVIGYVDSCEATDEVVVTVLNDDVDANAGIDVEICEGETTTLTASGGTTYLWSTGETTASIEVSPLDSTTYTVTAYSPSGNNQDQDDVVVTVNALPLANAGLDVEICFGSDTTLTASGGSTYLWNTGETSQSITVNPTTTSIYSVQVSDGNCTETDDVIVTVNPLPSVDAGENVGILEGESTTLTASGADTYLWSTGETTASISVAPSETTIYTVTGFLNGCEATDDVTVEIITETVIAEILGGDFSICEGTTVILTATGGASYLWSTGETTPSIEVSPTQNTVYTVTAFSPSGSNQDDDSITITVFDNPVANAGEDQVICSGESTILTASGGTSYLWSNGETNASISVNPTETTLYSVEVFNDDCSSIDDVLITVNPLPSVYAGEDITITEGESTTLTASGADTYLWSTGETTTSINVSPNNTTIYSVTGFSNGCEATDEVVVSVQLESVTANAGEDVSICFGESTTLTASGGSSYLWNTGETTAIITVNPNATTTYSVTVFNTAQTASDEDSVTVTVNDLPVTNAGDDVTIFDGEFTNLTATGADTYLWSTGETTASINVSPNSTTTYSVTGFTNGCEATDEVIVTVQTENINANAGDDVAICLGESTTLTATGGSSYLWNTGETTSSITVNPIMTTTYSVIVYNATQTVSDEDSVTVSVNDLPETNAGDDVTIFDGESITLTASGADSYLWSTGETAANINVSPNTTTTYTVTGFSNGCETTDDVTVTVEPSDFEASAGADRTICEGYETTLTATEGDSYLWSTGETTQSITVNPATTQTYSVTVFQGEAQGSANVTVEVDPNPDVVVTNGDNLMILEGEFITLSATGANTYLWSNGATQPNIAVSPSVTTTYEVTGYINDCEDTKSVLVDVVGHVIADAGEDMIICSGETVTLTATGGEEYLWNTGETTQSIEVSPDEDTEYSVLAYNALDSDEATVMVYVEDCTIEEVPPIEEGEFGFFVYQDPETEILKIRIDGLQDFIAKGISIYDMNGHVLYDEKFKRDDEFQTQPQMTREIPTDLFSRGIYMVRFNYDDTRLVKKFPIR